MNLNSTLLQYLDDLAIKLIECFEEFEVIDSLRENSSLDHRQGLYQMPPNNPAKIYTSRIENDHGEVSEYHAELNGKHYRLTPEGTEKFGKLLSAFHKAPQITGIVTHSYLMKHCFDWIANAFFTKQIPNKLTPVILDQIQTDIKQHHIFQKVLNLTISKEIRSADVTINFIPDNFFKQDVFQDGKKEDNDLLEKTFCGHVFADVEIKSTSERAEELALNYASVAVNIVKICMLTLTPDIRSWHFDLDKRSKVPSGSVSLVFNEGLTNMRVHAGGARTDTSLNSAMIDHLQQNVNIFDRFILSSRIEPFELQRLILEAISRLANVLGMNNHYSRVVELFSIHEQLLLKEDASIVASIGMYCSKLVHDNVDDRRTLISVYKRLYKVRSRKIHHGKEENLDPADLWNFQKTSLDLIIALIKLSEKFRTKSLLLADIDDAIDRAYTPPG